MGYTNIARDLYNDGSDITCHATTEITGKTFVTYAGEMRRDLIAVTTAATGDPVAGVAKYDADAEELIGVARGASRIITVTAGAPLVAGDKVEAGAGGKAVPLADGDLAGFAVAPAQPDTDALISLAY
ncbi:DUF2190 family protein [Corynebacterium appendicis]|uniref:capsid cement protein n=1 Tax=Corynebacterium appendicis TaxID=163202 RepID=UPI00223C2224|nr:capsid cement protein [Corynebacterium appendicis]MCT1683256.1 DUF2190 family protein [Corynebacterium appendicis]